VLIEKLPELRTHFPNLEPRFDDFYLLRFLRARKGDIPKTVKMLKSHFEWRTTKKIDELYYNHMTTDAVLFPEEDSISKIYPSGYWGIDDQRRPIYFERIGKTDFRELLKICTQERFLEYWIYQYEKMIWLRFRSIRPKNADLASYKEQTISFIDLKGLGWNHLNEVSRSTFREIVRLAANNYPEIMCVTFIINAPRTFSFIWSGLRPFVDPDTRAKIRLIPTTEMRTEIENFVNLEKLPDFLGGRVPGYGDGGLIDYGPWNLRHPIPPNPPSSFNHAALSNDTFVTCIEDDSQTVEASCYNSCIGCCPWWATLCGRQPLQQRLITE